MRDLTVPKLSFVCSIVVGFTILGVHWLLSGDRVGFFISLLMVCMTLLRWRMPKSSYTVIVDVVACLIFTPFVLVMALFSAMYYRHYWALFALAILFVDLYVGAVAATGALAGLFLGLWEKERSTALEWRDAEADRFYELESLQNDLVAATAQIERMTIVSERARIAREIHDNAGHEIVAAYMSLQTAREVIGDANLDALQLYDAALNRLDKGVNKIREAVHNLAPVTNLGVETLLEICSNFAQAAVEMHVYGDTAKVSAHAWGVLVACLNEALTNAMRHARPKTIVVKLDVTQHIVRMCVENKSTAKKMVIGNGLRNLRYRAASIGGSLSVDAGEVFRVICVIPVVNTIAV